MKIYLAARYSRRLELCGYREQLRLADFHVQARWLNGEHHISNEGVPIGESGESLVENDAVLAERDSNSPSSRAVAMREKFAQDDYDDVSNCDLLIAFTEPPRSEGGRSRGGRHVELGIALGQSKRIFVVGYRENLFCWLPEIDFYEDFGTALMALRVIRTAKFYS